MIKCWIMHTKLFKVISFCSSVINMITTLLYGVRRWVLMNNLQKFWLVNNYTWSVNDAIKATNTLNKWNFHCTTISTRDTVLFICGSTVNHVVKLILYKADRIYYLLYADQLTTIIICDVWAYWTASEKTTRYGCDVIKKDDDDDGDDDVVTGTHPPDWVRYGGGEAGLSYGRPQVTHTRRSRRLKGESNRHLLRIAGHNLSVLFVMSLTGSASRLMLDHNFFMAILKCYILPNTAHLH